MLRPDEINGKMKFHPSTIYRTYGVKISPQYDSSYLPQYHLPELWGRRGRRDKSREKHPMVHLQLEFTKIYGDIGPAVSGTIASRLLSL